MHCEQKLAEGLYWIGGDDKRLGLFEASHPVPHGMSYNNYLLLDEKVVLFDTIDRAVEERFFETVDYLLDGRKIDYIIVSHMEPDHSATLGAMAAMHPEAQLVCTKVCKTLIGQFFDPELAARCLVVGDGDSIETGTHTLAFATAPMVHWPEVMVTYDVEDKILFSADAFGSFGGLDGRLFDDMYDFEDELLDEVRRYYANIVGKYGTQVNELLDKADTLDIKMICPLHGYIIRKDFEKYLAAYTAWGTYTAEEQGVLVLYASPYGNTKNGAEILANELAAKGVDKMKLIDVSHTDPMYILPEVFRFSNLVIATTTYNGDMFIKMEEALTELRSMGVSNKKVSIIQSGSWAPTAGKKVQEMTDQLTGTEYVGDMVTIKGTVKEDSREALVALADAIAESLK